MKFSRFESQFEPVGYDDRVSSHRNRVSFDVTVCLETYMSAEWLFRFEYVTCSRTAAAISLQYKHRVAVLRWLTTECLWCFRQLLTSSPRTVALCIVGFIEENFGSARRGFSNFS